MQIDYYYTEKQIGNSCTQLNNLQLNELKNTMFNYQKYVVVIFKNNIIGKYFNLYNVNDYKHIMNKKSELTKIDNISDYVHIELLEWFYNKKNQIEF